MDAQDLSSAIAAIRQVSPSVLDMDTLAALSKLDELFESVHAGVQFEKERHRRTEVSAEKVISATREIRPVLTDLLGEEFIARLDEVLEKPSSDQTAREASGLVTAYASVTPRDIVETAYKIRETMPAVQSAHLDRSLAQIRTGRPRDRDVARELMRHDGTRALFRTMSVASAAQRPIPAHLGGLEYRTLYAPIPGRGRHNRLYCFMCLIDRNVQYGQKREPAPNCEIDGSLMVPVDSP